MRARVEDTRGAVEVLGVRELLEDAVHVLDELHVEGVPRADLAPANRKLKRSVHWIVAQYQQECKFECRHAANRI